LYGKLHQLKIKTLKNKIVLYFCLFCIGPLVAQDYQFKIVNSSTNLVVAKAAIHQGATLAAVSDADGIIILNAVLLPGTFQLKAFGFKEREIVLEPQPETQVIFMTPGTEMLSEVIVQSAHIPKSLQRTPAAITIVTTADFSRTDATNVLESFNNVPGIFVNQGALNTNKISIRGIGARSQYSTNRIQSYFDGIPLTTAEGDLTLDDFDQESLERIEIIKGPTSSMYGAGLGGSINLFSKNLGREGLQAKINTQFGSFNTQKQVVQVSNSSKDAALSATFTSLTSDGYRENGNYDRKSALVNGSLNAGKSGKLSYLVNFTQLKAFIPSSVNEETLINNPEVADVNWAKSQGFESYDRGLLGGSYTHSIFDDFKNTTSVFISFKNGYEPRPFNILKEERISAGIRTKFNWNTPLFEVPSAISFGAEYYNEWHQGGTFDNLYEDFPSQGSVLGPRLSDNDQDRKYANFFGQVNFDLSEKWNLEAGFNLNTTSYSLTDLFTSDAVNQSGNYRFDTVFSPRIGTSYEIGAGKNFYASVSQGFSTPTVAETLTPEGQINTDLKPENGTNYEIGFKGNWLENKLYTEIAVYSIQIENLLVAQRVAEDQYVGINAGKTSHNGAEFLANYRLLLKNGMVVTPYLSAAFNFFTFDTFTTNDTDFSGNKLPGVPAYTVNLGFDLKNATGFEFFANFRSVGEMPLDDANSVATNSYSLLNVKAGYRFTLFKDANINLYAGANNALDKRYASSIVPNAVGFGGRAPRYFYPGNPRNYYGGVQVTYVF
jgi:iron complex outermembrane receptor protein